MSRVAHKIVKPMTLVICDVQLDTTTTKKQTKQTPWSESASVLYRPSDRRLSVKLVSTFADRGCHVISVTDSYSRILGFLGRSRNFSFK
jgi:CBS-domain-containing membrane protein